MTIPAPAKKRYCDECRSWLGGCALGFKPYFRMPKGWADIHWHNWGHYRKNCTEFRQRPQP
jgi:hypothetical protein